MTVKLKNGNEFNVYNDGDKSEAGNFFNQAMAEWTKNKKWEQLNKPKNGRKSNEVFN